MRQGQAQGLETRLAREPQLQGPAERGQVIPLNMVPTALKAVTAQPSLTAVARGVSGGWAGGGEGEVSGDPAIPLEVTRLMEKIWPPHPQC